MENNNVNVNENVKMVGGFDNLDAYVDWLNSDESDDLANAYAEAMAYVKPNVNVNDNLVLIEEKSINKMHNIIDIQNKIIQEQNETLREIKETYIQVSGVIDEMNDIFDDAII